MRECSEHEIPLWKFLKFCHGYTERVGICIVNHSHEPYLTEDAFAGKSGGGKSAEEARLLKYFKDVPLWNLHVEYEFMHMAKEQGRFLTGVLVANCNYEDCREGLLLEKEDKRRAKRREYRARKRSEQK